MISDKNSTINIDIDKIIFLLLSNKKRILKSSFINLILCIIFYFFYPSQYMSSFVLMPNQEFPSSQIQNSAALFGLGDNFNNSKELFNTPDIVEKLLKSRSFSDKLIDGSIIINGQSNTSEGIVVNVLDIVIPKNANSENISEDFQNKLKSIIKINKDIETGIYNIDVIGDSPDIAFALCNKVVDDFLLTRKEILLSLTYEEKNYLKEQKIYLEDIIQKLESELVKFFETNSNYLESPMLILKHERLKNKLDLTSQIFWNNQQRLDKLYLEEISTISGLIIVDHPSIAGKAFFPTIKTSIIIFLLSVFFINIPLSIYYYHFKK